MKSFDQLVRVMAKLRSSAGCPWDRKQTHQSLLKYLFEESHELKKAVIKKDWDNFEEELGDILLQVVFHSQLAREKSRFSIDDVVKRLIWKLKIRHPHVFGYSPEHRKLLGDKKLITEKDVLLNWKALKALSRRPMPRKKAQH